MQLLIISHEYEPIASGGVTLIKELSLHLVKAGFEILILTPHLPGTLKCEKICDGVKVVRCGTLRNSVGNAGLLELLLFGILSIPSALRIIKKNNIDVILSIFLVPAGLPGVISAKLTGKPHAVFVGGADVPGVSSKFGRILGRLSFFLKLILRLSDKILVVEGLEKDVVDIDSEVVFTSVRNGVDFNSINRIHESAPYKRARKINILTIGRLIQRKGFLYIIEALGLVPIEKREFIHLSIVGYGPLENKLKNRIRELGLEKNVNLAGMIPKKKLYTYYNLADYYMFYSEPEGNSLALVEGMAYGLPIIISDVPGNKELFDNNGFILPYGNSKKLAELLSKLPDIEDQTAEKWGKNSRIISERYDWAEISCIYCDVLRSAVYSRKKAQGKV